MKRSARLQAAPYWLKKFTGKHVLRAYCRHFNVDWRCAAIELRHLGVRVDPQYLKQREVTEQTLAEQRRQRRQQLQQAESSYDFEDAWLLEFYIAGDDAACYDTKSGLHAETEEQPEAGAQPSESSRDAAW